MDDASLRLLEFDQIKAAVSDLCVSNLGKALCERLLPSTDRLRIQTALRETSEARLLVRGGHQPLQGLHDITEALTLAEKGQVLSPKDLLRIADTLRGAEKFRKFMRTKKEETPLLSSYAESIGDFAELVRTIETSVDGERVSDSADDDLRKVRRAIKVTESRIQERLSTIMSSPALRDAVQEGFVTQRNGRYVIPVRASHRAKVPGTVIAASSSGQTVFIEPAAVQSLVDEIVTLRAQEEELVYRVLCRLTSAVLDQVQAIRVTVEALAACDFALAKGRYSLEVDGIEPEMVPEESWGFGLGAVRHPLLGKGAVPADIAVGHGYRTLVVTGPNTGGKTVLLKTVGLACLLAQSGLHVPAKKAALPVFRDVLVDIGDHQSIQQSLSTFSSHMGRIAEILRKATPGCLVLLDEVGTGTDPREGAALACAILDYLWTQGCVTLATTHYGDVKSHAESRPGFMNGSMDFDQETLRPLYTLRLGHSGRSLGIIIAERLGIPSSVIAQARAVVTYGEGKEPNCREDLTCGKDVAHGEDLSLPKPETVATRDSRAGGGNGAGREESPMGEGSSSGSGRSDKNAGMGSGVRNGRSGNAESGRNAWSGSAGDSEAGKQRTTSEALPREKRFLPGDLVFVTSVGQKGRVAKEADEKGNVVVLVRGERLRVNWKRLRMLGKREDLYPDFPNYDLRIVLTSKEDRKLDKAMSKRPVDGVRVLTDESNGSNRSNRPR